jgi:hypothetical protein
LIDVVRGSRLELAGSESSSGVDVAAKATVREPVVGLAPAVNLTLVRLKFNGIV